MEKVVNDKKIWDEIYIKEEFNPGWGSDGVDKNLVKFAKEYCSNSNLDSFSILDIGCGNGRNSMLKEELEADGYTISYTGADFSKEAIEHCKRTYTDKEFIFLDITKDNPSLGTFDIIIDSGCFHAIPPESRSSYRDNLYSFSKDYSLIIIGTWLKEEEGQDSNNPAYYPYLYLLEWVFDNSDIETIFKGKFNLVSSYIDKAIYKKVGRSFVYFNLIKNQG